MTAAQAQLVGELGAFTSRFTEEKPSSVDMIKLILDGLTLFVGLSSATFWNKIAENISKTLKDSSWTKETANAAIAFGIAFAKDKISE